MALAFLNRCVWRATSTGTGSFVVASAITGYKVPNDCAGPAVSDGATYFYFAQSDDKTQWEIGYDAFDVATSTLPRTNILDSTNAGAAVSFSAAPSVFMGGTLANDWPFSGLTLSAGVGNNVNIECGEGTSGAGGGIFISGGDGNTDGGGFIASAGGGTTGAGGSLDFNAGSGDTSGGVITFDAGGSASGPGGGISFTTGAGATNGGTFAITLSAGTVNGGDFTVSLPAAGSGRQGLIILTGLPTADPTVAGALWSNSGVLTVSAG